jgi:hypothetical protein
MSGADCIDVSWDLCNFLLSGGDQMQISGGATKISVTNSRFAGWGMDAAGTYNAIATAANAGTYFNIAGNKFVNDSDFSGNEWRGVTVNAGTYLGYRVRDNTSFGLTGTFVTDAGTASVSKSLSGNDAY